MNIVPIITETETMCSAFRTRLAGLGLANPSSEAAPWNEHES